MKLALGVLLLSSLAALGTGCSAEPADAAASSESQLVLSTRLDQVTPAEVAKVYAVGVIGELDACIRNHPEITRIDAQTVYGFTHWGSISYYHANDFLDAMLEETPEFPVAGIQAKVEPFATQQMSRYVDAGGFYDPPQSDFLTFYSAHRAAKQAKAFAAAAPPGGKPWSEIRQMWHEVQDAQGNLDSDFALPVKMASSNPTAGDIGRALKMPFGMYQQAWGNAAVDEFGEAGEGPDGVGEWFPLADFLKTSAIKKRWYFIGGGDEWSTHWLVVLDDHDQLWALNMGYSE